MPFANKHIICSLFCMICIHTLSQTRISQQHKADSMFKAINTNIEKIDYTDIEMLVVYGFWVEDNEKTITKLKDSDFISKLNISRGDSLKYSNKINTLFLKNRKTKIVVNQMLATIDYGYYKRGMTYLADKKYHESEKMFLKSIKANFNYINSHYRLAQIYSELGNTNKTAEIISRAFVSLKMDNKNTELFLNIAKITFNKFLFKGKELINNEKYNEAISLLNNGKDFCKKTPSYVCNDSINILLLIAKQGIYQSYLNVINKALENTRPDLAERYIQLTLDYMLSNKSSFPDFEEVILLKQKTINKYIQKGNHHNKENEYHKAIQSFQDAKVIYDSMSLPDNIYTGKIENGIRIARNGIYQELLSNANKTLTKDYRKASAYISYANAYKKANSDDITTPSCNDTIYSKINKNRYANLIQEGIILTKEKRLNLALRVFYEAKELGNNCSYENNELLDSMIRLTAKPALIKYIQSGNIKAWSNDLATAEKTLNIGTTNSIKYLLKDDTEILFAIYNLRQKINKRKCDNLNDEYNLYLDKARRFIKSNKFQLAQKPLNKAIEKTTNKCAIDKTIAKDIKKEYIQAIEYQKLTQTLEKLIKAENYQDFNIKLGEVINYYNTNNISRFEIPVISLNEFAHKSYNNDFILFCTKIFLENNDLKNTFLLLKLLQHRQFTSDKTKEIQKELGAKLSKRDFLKYPNDNATNKAYNYTKNLFWFKSFKKAYIKGYK